jgi:hypothetical protein
MRVIAAATSEDSPLPHLRVIHSEGRFAPKGGFRHSKFGGGRFPKENHGTVIGSTSEHGARGWHDLVAFVSPRVAGDSDKSRKRVIGLGLGAPMAALRSRGRAHIRSENSDAIGILTRISGLDYPVHAAKLPVLA